MASTLNARVDQPDLGKPQWSSHTWIEPVIVVSLMIGSLVLNRRRNYSILGNKAASPSLLGVSNANSYEPVFDDRDDAIHVGRHLERHTYHEAASPTRSAQFGRHLHSRILQKFPFLVEMFYWALNYCAYSITKATAAIMFAGHDGVTQLAQDHGVAILHIEHDSILRFLFPIQEADFQHFFLNGHTTAMTFFNRIYSLVHIPGTVAFLSWYYYAAPDHATFAIARRTMTLGNFAAFIVFCFFPCMPPRLLPESFGFHDTVRQENAESVWVGGANVNQLAAMPSLHFTYAFVIACTFMHHSGITEKIRGKRNRSRSTIGRCFFVLLGIFYPLLVLTVIVATANHYWLDATIATLTVSLAFCFNRIWMVLLPLEECFLWILRLEKPIPTTGDRTARESDRHLEV
ncbi:hypothetical protein MBLNU459_g4195t2 [Dothideomycetes sp. NU459]